MCAGNDSYYTRRVNRPNNLILPENHVGNENYGHQITWLKKYGKNAICSYTIKNIYQPLKNTLRSIVYVLTDDSCHSLRKNHEVKGYYTADSKTLKVTLTIETASDSISATPAACSRTCGQAAFGGSSNTALEAPKVRSTIMSCLRINFEIEAEKNHQSFFDWRAKQKPSRRAGFVNTAIRDSPGLIRGRLEPQRGRSLTVKAVWRYSWVEGSSIQLYISLAWCDTPGPDPK